MKEYGFALKKARSKQYPTETITDADYTDLLAPHANIPAQGESLLHSLEQAARDIGLYVNPNRAEFISFK